MVFKDEKKLRRSRKVLTLMREYENSCDSFGEDADLSGHSEFQEQQLVESVLIRLFQQQDNITSPQALL
jgi:hypothetical protein